MITRREKKDLGYMESIVRDKVETMVSEISESENTYLDEIYQKIDSRIELLESFGEISIPMLTDDDYVESKYYTDIATSANEMSTIAFASINDLYTKLNYTIASLYSKGENIVLGLKSCEEVLNAVESNVKRNTTLESVKDENIVMDSFLSKDFINEEVSTIQNTSTTNHTSIGDNTLGIDLAGGYVTLYPVDKEYMYYNVKDIKINKPKGSIAKPANSRSTLDYFTNGYFHTSVLSPNPVFEVEGDSDLEPIMDQDVLTSYSIEYYTLSPSDELTFAITIEFENESVRVDNIDITLDPGSMNGVLSQDNILPYISKVTVNDSDVTEQILDNRIMIKDTTIGKIESDFTVSPPNVYPCRTLNISKSGVKTITIEFKSDIPQSVFYNEKVLLDNSRKQFYRLNYFETLVMDEYTGEEDRPDPMYMYSEAELDKMQDMYDTAAIKYNEQIKINRFFISIKDISIYSNVYDTSGFMISENLNANGKSIASVELFCNETIPDETSIKYYISTDKNIWYDIVPSNRTEGDGPRRIIYGGIEASGYDNFINITSDKVYVKIEMFGTGGETPVLKSYVARIKLR